MESYFFSYTYTNPPVINGVTTKQSYIGLGFAPVGTYKPGQTITILDKATGLQKVGTYQIGNVNDKNTFDANKINHVVVNEYDYFNQQYIQGTGLQNNNAVGIKGLGSEGGILLGQFFNNQNAAIRPIHF
jgi:hypothetical protein